MDFTIESYTRLLSALKESDYQSVTFTEYMAGIRPKRFVILRHDVDLRPERSLEIAKIEKDAEMIASYYFRAVEGSWDETIIRRIANLGHEIGYHYESLTTCNGDLNAALNDFQENLTRLRELAPVQTICMHGSPRSPYDSRLMWKEKDYRSLGILGEPYFDVDFSDVFYLTDTGRRWDGFKVSVRDKIESHQDNWRKEGLVFHTTDDIIRAISESRFPKRVMVTTHPQRWTNAPIPWIKELIGQKIKNTIKFFIVRAES